MDSLRDRGEKMKNETTNAPRPTGKIFRAEYESRFGNMPEFGARVLCAFAETFDAELWEPVLDDLAINDGFSTQKKPMIHDLKRSLSRIIAKKNAAVVSDRDRNANPTRTKTGATAVEVDTIIAAAQAGGAELSAWISDARRLSVAVRPGALTIIADAFRVSTDWATWAVSQLDAGIDTAEIRSQIAPVLSDAPDRPTGGNDLATAFAAVATSPDRSDPFRTIGESGRPLKKRAD